MSRLIGNIVLQPDSPRPAETVRVEVFDGANNPIDAKNTAVTINGIPGAVQYLQFPTAGERRLVVRAVAADGTSERKVVPLDVRGETVKFQSSGGREDIAMIGVTQSATHPYQAVLTLGSFIDTRSPAVLSLNPAVPPKTVQHLSAAEVAARFSPRGALRQVILENVKSPVRVETRRLINMRTRPATRRTRGPIQVRPRLATSAIYDLTNVNLNTIFGSTAAAQARRFEWDFGDGTTATTASPFISHDYFAAIDHASGMGQFVVTCHIADTDITVKRSLTIRSAYTMCKRTGTIVPHVTSEVFAHKRYKMLTSAFTIHNVEEKPLILDRMSVSAVGDDGDGLALHAPFVNLGRPITIAPHSSAMIGVNVPFVESTPNVGELRYDVKGFSVLYGGTCDGYPVRCSAVFDVPVAEWDQKPQPIPIRITIPGLEHKPWPWEVVEKTLGKATNPAAPLTKLGDVILDTNTGTVAASLGALRDSRPASQRRTQAMQLLSSVYAPIDNQLLEQGRLAMPRRIQVPGKPRIGALDIGVLGNVARRALGGIGNGIHTFGGSAPPPPAPGQPPQPGPIAEGQICDPDNLTEEELAQADAEQLVCQLADEVMDVQMPARWMNARKGDIILSPGGDGIIGGLMLNVNPPQWYSHSGIMTRNYDEITHSTGSRERLMDHMIGVVSDGSDGFEPSVLKYMWPGAITQTVQHSIEGEMFPDPEYDKSYSVSSFGPHTVGITHNDHMVMIPPLVVKPDPMQETPAVRSALHAIATDARNAGGRPGVKSKYHYRWYCYTDPTIGKGAPEGSDAGWAAGTLPSVCSSFIWLQAKGRNAHLETSQALVTPTDLEQSDIDQGAVVRPTTPDGLYTYSAEERHNAGQWLYDTIYNQAYEKAGWFGEILTDGADDIANQFLNAFANNDADGKDSTEWENAVDADAVSPDNILWWDAPAGGGLYGYAEPAIYREPRIESYQVSKWKKVLKRGTILGRVFDADGNLAGGAMVQLYDGKTAFTGSNGSFTLTDVPLGAYSLKASKVIDGMLQSAHVSANLQAAELKVDVHLQPPADRYRIAQLFIDFWGRDSENWPESDEIDNPGPEYFELELGPDKLINSTHRTYKWGGEVRMEYAITVRLLVNNTIDVAVQGTLYEGTSEDTTDLDGQGGLTFQVPVGGTKGATLTVTNTDEDADDAGVLSISVKNVRNNN